MPSIDVIIETTPVYITVTPQTNPNIQVKFGAVDSVNGETGTVLINAVPNGGTTGQVLAKNSNTDNDTGWINVSAGGVQTLTGTTNRISIDNTDPANPIANIAASYDTAVTNAIAAAVSGKEDVANKQTDLTPSATKYPTVDAVIAGLTTKKVYVPLVHSTGQNPTNVADGLIYVWGLQGVSMGTIINTGIRSLREYGAPVTGKIVGCVFSIRSSNIASSETSTLYFCNSTTNVQTQLSNTITHVGTTIPGGGSVYNKEWVITGLNIPVTVGDLCQSCIRQPNWATNPISVYYNITYLIELP